MIVPVAAVLVTGPLAVAAVAVDGRRARIPEEEAC